MVLPILQTNNYKKTICSAKDSLGQLFVKADSHSKYERIDRNYHRRSNLIHRCFFHILHRLCSLNNAIHVCLTLDYAKFITNVNFSNEFENLILQIYAIRMKGLGAIHASN